MNEYTIININNETIIIRNTDRYINITKLFSSSIFKDWIKLNASKDLIAEVEELLNSKNASSLIYKSYNYVNGSSANKGTYVHPILAISIMSYVDIKLFMKLYNFFLEHYEKEMNDFINFNYTTQKIIKLEATEESFILNLYKALKNNNLICQYPIDKYKIDCVYINDLDNEIILFEYDEKDHAKYDKYSQLKRYKTIFNNLNYNKISIIRFSDSIIYDEEYIISVIRYNEKLISKQNVIYVNYNKDNEINISEFINGVSQFSFNYFL
jgi:hypothetical protein